MQELILRDGAGDFFDLINYPDGQHNIKLNLDKISIKDFVTIKCSIKNFLEIEVLLCIVAALKKNDFTIKRIEFVYLFGMRSDRAFESGMPNYFRDVLSPIINSMSINEIEIYVPHNKMILSYIKNIDTRRIADGDFSSCEIKNNVIVICGDKSFINERYYYHFNKKRKSEEIFVFLDEESMRDISQSTGDILIIDDLCDGGKTFIEEAKYLKKLFPDKKLYLQVTHAIFSKGINVVADHFERIFCTNSYQDITHPKVTQIKVI